MPLSFVFSTFSGFSGFEFVRKLKRFLPAVSDIAIEVAMPLTASQQRRSGTPGSCRQQKLHKRATLDATSDKTTQARCALVAASAHARTSNNGTKYSKHGRQVPS